MTAPQFLRSNGPTQVHPISEENVVKAGVRCGFQQNFARRGERSRFGGRADGLCRYAQSESMEGIRQANTGSDPYPYR